MTIHATVSGAAATLVSHDVGEFKPATILHTAQGMTDLKAAVNLARKLVENGWDPGSKFDCPPQPLRYLGQYV